MLRTLRRLVERIWRDPHASDVNCGICWAWVPEGGIDCHIDALHR